jgi:DNA-binding XRE family transcriptional regulator
VEWVERAVGTPRKSMKRVAALVLVRSKTGPEELGLGAIRDSRIDCRMAFGTLPEHVRHQKFAAGAFPRRLRVWRERNNLSQSEAALKLQISKRTLQEWEHDRAAPRGLARIAIEKAIRA